MNNNFNQTNLYNPSAQNALYNARITLFDSNSATRYYELSSFGKNIVTFGRDPMNDICLTSRFVSHFHGRFRFDGKNWIIEDLGSKNGLLYMGSLISAKILKENDNIRIDDADETKAIGVLFIFNTSNEEVMWRNYEIGDNDEITVGRGSNNQIILNHVGVSRHHAVIVREKGKYYIHDNNSTNGIFINGIRVSGKALLHEKDVITITNSKLIFTSANISYCTFNKGIKVEASNIVKKVDRGRKIISNNVSLKINPCELVAIIGGSGAGKSTIMNCISGYNKPTSGTVAVNGVELYSNFESMKDIIGYVPQRDIVFDNLTVYSMLKYTAKLRLPKDTSNEELDAIINKVIDTVELTPRKDTMIKRLSGGQRKRASIAVELISDPSLFFLDEPASGLDPGTERHLMQTLKEMSSSGKTVIFVTHSTLNLHVCDKIVFMGEGGRLCFMGNYTEAMEFFGVDDLVDVYNMITENSEYWERKYNSVRRDMPNIKLTPHKIQKKKSKHGWFSQIKVLTTRHLHILVNDRARLLLLLFQAPLLAILIAIVADGEQYSQQEMTQSLLFALSCSALWVGILNAIQEICKERVILRREYMTGLHLGAYIVSKMSVMGLICIIQAFLLTSMFAICVDLPETGIIFPAFFEFYLTTFLTSFSASAMGIFVSALFKDSDKAMTVAPLLLMPQLLYSGIIFKLEGIVKTVSYLVICRFSMEAYGTTADLNILTLKIIQENPDFQELLEIETISFYEYTVSHFLQSLGVLAAYAVIFTILAGIAVRGVKKDY
ncbi:MAG: ATP-binding cassette domain-containing protein [Clostridia bacterium]|nr:ATP-binding cassette domain-containing protein [Clostridia bacterium]